MKSFLALVLVLGLASVAGAALQISVGGDQNPGNDITIGVNDTLIIDIWTDSPIVPFTGVNYLMGVDASLGSFNWSGATFTPIAPGTNAIDGPWPGGSLPDPPPGEEGFYGEVFNMGDTDVAAGTVLVDNIVFQCLGAGDAVINLYHLPDTGPTEEFDSVTIHQIIPEPATLGLMAFGAFLLRRRCG